MVRQWVEEEDGRTAISPPRQCPPVFPFSPLARPPVNTLPDTTAEPVETPTADAPKHAQCKLCRDGTYATKTMQSFVGDDNPWDFYCDPCAVAFASVLRDAQHRDAEIRLLPVPPAGKAAPKAPRVKVEPIPKPAKGRKGSQSLPAKAVDAPAPTVASAVAAPKPPVEVRRMSLAEAMRPTAPKPAPAIVPVPPPVPAPPPLSAKNAKKALQDAARDVEGYDLLTMLGMKR